MMTSKAKEVSALFITPMAALDLQARQNSFQLLQEISRPLTFDKCETIASFYDRLNVPGKQTEGILGGKNYVWSIKESDQSMIVSCKNYFGLGKLAVTNTQTNEALEKRYFSHASDVNLRTSTVILRGVLNSSLHVVRLPRP